MYSSKSSEVNYLIKIYFVKVVYKIKNLELIE